MKARIFLTIVLSLVLLAMGGATNAQGLSVGRYLTLTTRGPGIAQAGQAPNEMTQMVATSSEGDPTLRVDWIGWSGSQLVQIPSSPAPAGWQLLGFDDSDWSRTVATHFAAWDSAPFCNAIGGSTVAHPDGGVNQVTYLVRKRFTIPAPPAGYILAGVRARGWADNGAHVWLNGSYIGSWFMSQEPDCAAYLSNSLAPIVGENLLAIQLSNTDDAAVNPIGVAFEIEAVYRLEPTATPTSPPSPTPTATPTVPTPTPTATPTATPTSTATPTFTPTATPTATPTPLPPRGNDVLSARVFVDYRCDGHFKYGVDHPLKDAAVTIRFPNGGRITRYTKPNGIASFTGFDASAGLSVQVTLPEAYKGHALRGCFNSPMTVKLKYKDFSPGLIAHKFIQFGVGRVTR